MKFNAQNYNNNNRPTLQMAEKVMVENGYSNFTFKGASFTNGASFYFDVDGKEVRVSDHPLTGKRAFETIQLNLFEVKTISIKKEEPTKTDWIAEMIAKRNEKIGLTGSILN